MSTRIDETAYVQAPEGADSLAFTNEKQEAKFELGVSLHIHAWDGLDIAVSNNWGGPLSAEKRDWMTGVVIDLFKDNKIVDVALIEEVLLYAMVDEFDTQIEDDSALEVADKIIKMYGDVEMENYSKIEQMFEAWKIKQAKNEKRVVDVQGEDSSDDEDEDEEVDEDGDVDMEAEPAPEPQGPIVDDDGFELVQKGKRRY